MPSVGETARSLTVTLETDTLPLSDIEAIVAGNPLIHLAVTTVTKREVRGTTFAECVGQASKYRIGNEHGDAAPPHEEPKHDQYPSSERQVHQERRDKSDPDSEQHRQHHENRNHFGSA